MIDIKELSIGNWIENTNGNTGKVIGITEQGEVIVRYSENSTCYSEPRVLEPVEITPEILEKNGWKFHAMMSDYPADYVLAEDYYSIIVNEVTDGLYQFKIVGEEIINTTEIIHASYVHQLQNALTLCGINKNIEL